MAKLPVYNCFFDGACGPNNPGGAMGWGGIIINEKDEEVLCFQDGKISRETNTNNVAEYLALERILDFLLTLETKLIINIKGDSKLVIMQMIDRWRIKEGHYVNVAWRCKEKLQELKEKQKIKGVNFNPHFTWIPREENAYADVLSKQGMPLI